MISELACVADNILGQRPVKQLLPLYLLHALAAIYTMYTVIVATSVIYDTELSIMYRP